MSLETFVVSKAFPGFKPGAEAQFEPADVQEYVASGHLLKKDAAAVGEVETELDQFSDRLADAVISKTLKKFGEKSKGAAPFGMSIEGVGTHAEAKEEGSLGEILQSIGWASAPSFGQELYQRGVNVLSKKYELDLPGGAVSKSANFKGSFDAATRMDGAVSKTAGTGVQQESVGGLGGFAVAPQFSETFFELLFPRSVLLSEVVRRVVTGLDYYEPTWNYGLGGPTAGPNGTPADPYLAGMSGGWIPEGAPFTLTTANILQFHLKMNLFGSAMQVTRQLLFDAPRLQQTLMEKFSQVAAFYLTSAIFSAPNAAGTGKPKGILTSPAAMAVTRTASPGNGDLLTDLASVFSKRLTDEGSTGRLFWMISPSAEKQLILLNDKTGRVVFLPNFPGPNGGSVTGRVPMLLFGIPVIRTQFASQYGTAGDFNLIDPSAYVLGMRQDLEISASEHVGFLSNLMTYRMLLRADGGSPVNKYLTLANGDTVSPFPYLS